MSEIQDAIVEIDVMLPPKEFAREIAKIVCEKFGFSFAAVAGFDDGAQQAVIEYFNIPEGFKACECFSGGAGISGKCPCYDSREKGLAEYISFSRLAAEYPEFYSGIERYAVKAIACVPLKNKGRVFGSCVFYDTSARARQGDEPALLTRLGILLSGSISNNRYLDQLRRKTVELEKEIADRRRAEVLLAQEKERISVMIHSIGDGLIAVNEELHVTLMNEAAEKFTGWTSAEAIGRPVADIFNIVNARNRERCESPVLKAFKTGAVVGLVHATILIGRHGNEHFLSASCAPIKGFEGKTTGVIVVFRDITDRKIMEEELIKASKLESIGILAGGIAHDFNNLLTGIIGNISFAKMLSNRDDKVFDILTKAETVAFQAKDLTSQFRTFSKGGSPIKKPLLLSEFLENTAEFVVRGSKSRCVFEIDDDISSVEVDESQIAQVITNLLINSIQAMPDGGVITIKARNIEIDDDSVLALTPGKYARISVIDTGVGISPENILRIFDPYFTTKPKGSGLGLTTSYSIARKHFGTITVESEVGNGTKFHLYLPALARVAEKSQPDSCTVRTSRFRVLAMDDEAVVREVTMQLLTHLGYDVVLAKDGGEAIDFYKKSLAEGSRFDIVIMDLVVPGGVGGVEAIAELLKIDPTVNSIVSSGYSNEIVMSKYSQYGFKGVISKPYRIKELDELIQKVILISRDRPDKSKT